MNRIRNFARKHPVRVAAWVSATVAIVVTALAPDLPVQEVTVFVLATLGLGEYAQRVENDKTHKGE
jgi:hypothetical protein